MPKDKGDSKIKDLRPDKNLNILSEAEEEQLEAIEEAVKDDDARSGDPSGQKIDQIINGHRDADTRGIVKSKLQ